jgi:pimeloyl-ACP methyl ester carboxylesterase
MDSTYNLAVDPRGNPVGKRWDCLATEGRANLDLAFIENVVAEQIPKARPPGSGGNVHLTGISNGGFMTILAATHLGGIVTAFAPVSAGDPYGTRFDMETHPEGERQCAPGVFVDLGTGAGINESGACAADAYPNELTWPPSAVKPPFSQFHNQGDAACDISCMEKAQKLLVEHGYQDEGAQVIPSSTRSVLKHLWQADYNRSLIDFFKAAD